MNTITSLEALIAPLKEHIPAVSQILTPLIPELRLIQTRNLGNTRDRVDLDVENLITGLSAIIEMRTSGLVNDDVIAAEEAMTALALDVRSRTSAIIKARTADMRIHAEVAAHRVDPTLEITDMTSDYRELAAAPVSLSDDQDGPLRVQNLGLPETGGYGGRIVGDILIAAPCYLKEAKLNAGPLDTLYLPLGHSVTLSKGEQIRVYACGGRTGGEKLIPDDFQVKFYYRDIQIVDEVATLYGPATFSIARFDDFVALKQLATDVESVRHAAMPEWVRKSVYDGPIIFMTFLFFFCSAAVIAFLAGMTELILTLFTGSGYEINNPDKFVLAYLLLAIGGLFLSATSKIMTRMFVKRKIKSRLLSRLPQLNKLLSGRDFDGGRHDCDEVIEVSKQTVVTRMFRFYPLRKVLVDDQRGLQTIEPLTALPAPQPEININTVVKMNARG